MPPREVNAQPTRWRTDEALPTSSQLNRQPSANHKMVHISFQTNSVDSLLRKDNANRGVPSDLWNVRC